MNTPEERQQSRGGAWRQQTVRGNKRTREQVSREGSEPKREIVRKGAREGGGRKRRSKGRRR